MRSDEANRILGLRVNVWTSVVVFLLGVGSLVLGRSGTSCGAHRSAPTEPSLNIRDRAGSHGRTAGSGAILPDAVAKAVHARLAVLVPSVPAQRI